MPAAQEILVFKDSYHFRTQSQSVQFSNGDWIEAVVRDLPGWSKFAEEKELPLELSLRDMKEDITGCLIYPNLKDKSE
jgi:hypothetical protein